MSIQYTVNMIEQLQFTLDRSSQTVLFLEALKTKSQKFYQANPDKSEANVLFVGVDI